MSSITPHHPSSRHELPSPVNLHLAHPPGPTSWGQENCRKHCCDLNGKVLGVGDEYLYVVCGEEGQLAWDVQDLRACERAYSPALRKEK